MCLAKGFGSPRFPILHGNAHSGRLEVRHPSKSPQPDLGNWETLQWTQRKVCRPRREESTKLAKKGATVGGSVCGVTQLDRHRGTSSSIWQTCGVAGTPLS